jgi:hypothetical protein
MRDENLVNGLRMNKISEENIELFLQLKEISEKLGFEFCEKDCKGEWFLVTFAIKDKFGK